MAASTGVQMQCLRGFQLYKVLSRPTFHCISSSYGGVTYCRKVFFTRCIKACAIEKQQYVITPETKVDQRVVSNLENSVGSSGYIKFKKHAGVMRLTKIQLPARLLKSIKILLEKYPVESLQSKGKQLQNYLQARKPPISKREFDIKAREVEHQILTDADKEHLSSLEGDDLEAALRKHKKKILTKLRSKIYHWQPMEYDAYTSYMYLVGRMTWDYAVAYQCFSEIANRDPSFKPTSIYCFGSKVGSSIWAADSIWKKIPEHYCVDSSGPMNTIARLLLQDGKEQLNIPAIKGVTFRQFQPSPKENKFSLVISPFMLLEQASAEERLQLVYNLWEMTEKYLVLIDNGTNAGFDLIDEAREFLLSLSDDNPQNSLNGHVFAPCPHDKSCPKKVYRQQSCLTECDYMEVDPRAGEKNVKTKSYARYSYVILKKGPRTSATEWPRVLQSTKSKKLVHCHLCLPNGNFQHVVITQGKFDKNLYKCARVVRLGDRLPVSLEPIGLEPPNSEPDSDADSAINEERILEELEETMSGVDNGDTSVHEGQTADTIENDGGNDENDESQAPGCQPGMEKFNSHV